MTEQYQPGGPAERPRVGKRRRRLYWTVALLVAAALAGGAVGVSILRGRAPEVYRSGEEHAEITKRLELRLPDSAPTPKFVDVTDQAGLSGFRSFAGERTSQLPEDMGGGAAWGDFDGDGDDDLFLVSAGGAMDLPTDRLERSRLYRNEGAGKFTEVEDFPETRIHGMGAAWGDYDSDGLLDLVVTAYGELRLFRNTGSGFERRSALGEWQGYWAGASWADFDLDDDLDLYVTGYVRYEADTEGRAASRQYGRAVPYTLNPASFEPQSNLLFLNDGHGGFTEVAADVGVDNPAGRSLGALWNDFNDDGWPDLYVANDISDNALYINDEGRFEDAGLEAWVADYRGAMGLASADWDRDGDDDLFVTHWIAQENALYQSAFNDLSGEKRLRFMDVADQQGLGQIALQRVGWGAEFVDIDSDGWLDLAVACGSTFETEESPKELQPQRSFLFWSREGKTFHDLAPLVPALAVPRASRGLAVSDHDLDGDPDLLFVDLDGGVRLLENRMPQGSWVQLELRRAAHGPTHVEGARVIVVPTSGPPLRRTITGASYLSQSSRTLHVGLGSASGVERVEVVWPDGEQEVYDAVEVGSRFELTQGQATTRRLAMATPAPSDPAGGRAAAAAMTERERVTEFWRRQRAAMNAFKVDQDCERAIPLYRSALELDPEHQDSLYYLGNCLAATGEAEQALDVLQRIKQINPMSHRALKGWGTLRAETARTSDDLDQALRSLERAHAVNREETGVLQALAEVSLMKGDAEAAREHLELLIRANPQAGGGLFMLAYIAWKEDDDARAAELLRRAVGTRKEEWIPAGAVAEGDVRRRMHRDATPLLEFVERWDGATDPNAVFGPLEARLEQLVVSLKKQPA